MFSDNNHLNTNLKYLFYKLEYDNKYIFYLKASEIRLEEKDNYNIINTYIISLLHTCPNNKKFYIILDLYKLQKKNIKIKHLIQLTKLLNVLFPERLKICYVINTPFFFQTIYSIIIPFIDKTTKKKNKFCKNKKDKKFNLNLISN